MKSEKEMHLPKITNAIKSERYRQLFIESVSMLVKAVEDKEIPNPRMNEAKSRINRGLEMAFDELINEPFFYKGNFQNLSEFDRENFDSSNRPSLSNYKAWVKRLQKAQERTPLVRALADFLTEMEELVNTFDEAKTYVVKGGKKKEEEKDIKKAYVAPSASLSGKKVVYELLTDISEKARDKLTEVFADRFKKHVADFLKLQAAYDAGSEKEVNFVGGRFNLYAIYRNRQRMNLEAYEVLSKVAEPNDNRLDTRYSIKNNSDELIHELAVEEANRVREAFVVKNLKKLDSIIERKNNLEEAVLVSNQISSDGLISILQFKFKDGSSFRVSNSVVFASSKYGKLHAKYPLRFHDVKMPGGATMKMPSEEKMNTIFAMS